MKSVKIKVIILVLSCVIFSSISIGVIGIWSSHRVLTKDSLTIMNLLCENKAESFNEIFKRVEQSVETLTIEVKENIKVASPDMSYSQLASYAEKLLPNAINLARNTEGVISVYFRYDPSYGSSSAGFFAVKENNSNSFILQEPTDLSLYSVDDREHVAWFYECKISEESVWLAPYHNKNIDVDMISYVNPVYIDGKFLGVIGMDINFDELVSIVEETSIYKSGYAFLADDKSNIVYHHEIETGANLINFNDGEFSGMAKSLLEEETNTSSLIEYTYDGINKEATFRSLENGMRFIVTAPKSEIVSQANELLTQMIYGVLVVISIVTVLTFIFAKRLVQPLIEITAAAKKIAAGDLNVSISHKSRDEVGELAESFRQTVVHLDNYFTYINKLAYKDSLTGVRNKTAYMEMAERMNLIIDKESINFSLVVFDLNDLKNINDSLGHDIGDLAIISACRIICRSFKDIPVYRIGGDEFVVLLENENQKHYNQCIHKFNEEIRKQNEMFQYNTKIFMAYGKGDYEVGIDHVFNDVFKKADNAMYQQKQQMKSI